MKTQFTDCYDLLIKQFTEIDQLLSMSEHDRFDQELPTLRMRQKKELDNIQDKWILTGGGTEKKLFGWEEAPVMNRVIAGYTTTRTPEGMRSSE
jgi:hypothetical protein